MTSRSDKIGSWIPLLLSLSLMLQHTMPGSFAGVWQGGWPIIGAFALWTLYTPMHQAKFAGYWPLIAWVGLSGIAVGLAGYGYPIEGSTHWPAVGELSNISVATSIRMFSLSSLSIFLLVCFMIASLSNKTAKVLSRWLGLCGVVTALSIIFEGLVLRHNVKIQVAIGDNPSMSATFAVIGIVYVISSCAQSRTLAAISRNRAIAALSVLLMTMLLMVGRSTPMLAAAAGLFVLVRRKCPKLSLAAALVGGGILILRWPTQAAFEAMASGRVEVWSAMLYYWKASKARMLFGTGLGTVPMLIPLLTGQGWFFAHSDIIQLGFTLGIVGLLVFGLALWRYAIAIKGNVALQATSAAFLASTFTDFPLSSPLHLLWIIAFLGSTI